MQKTTQASQGRFAPVDGLEYLVYLFGIINGGDVVYAGGGSSEHQQASATTDQMQSLSGCQMESRQRPNRRGGPGGRNSAAMNSELKLIGTHSVERRRSLDLGWSLR